jgi:hypothetical protein
MPSVIEEYKKVRRGQTTWHLRVPPTPIKPCPFCHEDELLDLEGGDRYFAIGVIKCCNCGAEGPSVSEHHGFEKKPKLAERLKKWEKITNQVHLEACERWNNRP